MDRVKPFDTSTLTVTYGSLAGWQNAAPESGIEGSVPSVEAWTHTIEEIVYTIEQSGQTPDHTNLHQLAQAIQALAGQGGSTTLTNLQVVGGRSVELTGTGTWTVPDSVTTIRLIMNGGGGGGGGCFTAGSTPSSGSGGGGGEYAMGVFTVTPGQQFAYSVASIVPGGLGASTPTAGGNGGTTSFGGLMSAVGGGGGKPALNTIAGTAGAGGTGGSGGSSRRPGVGGGYGPQLVGGIQGGQGGSSPFGGPGPGPNVNQNGSTGIGPGGGGSGGAAQSTSLSGNGNGGSNGGNGAAGYLRIEY